MIPKIQTKCFPYIFKVYTPNTSYLTDSYIGFTLKMESVLKNDGEKWSRKIYFEIPPCGKIVIVITKFVILGTFMK